MVLWWQEIVLRIPFSPCLSNADMTAHIGTPHYHHHQGWFLKSLISFTDLSCGCVSKTKGISLHHRIFRLQSLVGTEKLNSTLSRITQTIPIQNLHCGFILLESSSSQFMAHFTLLFQGHFKSNSRGKFHSWLVSLPNFYHFLINSSIIFAFSNS